MKAMVLTRFGAPEGLQLREVPKPTPKDDEVLVKVRAASVFAGDAELRGLRLPLATRLPVFIYFSFLRPKPLILGQELAGDVEAVGNAVQGYRPGDAVYAATGFGLGAYAEYVCLPTTPQFLRGTLAPKPANLSYGEAATMPVGGLEALHFMRQARLRPGERVLINGAGGSIGTVAVQLAKDAGAEVTATDSAHKLDTLRGLGADDVLDYAQADFTRQGQTYDVIVDVVGKSNFGRSLGALTPAGRYLLVNPSQHHHWQRRWANPGGRQIITGAGPQRAADLRHLTSLIEAGRLKPAVDRSYPLEQLAEAHRYVDAGRKRGTVTIWVIPPR